MIQPSSRRAYTMKEYEKAGAVLSDDLSQADTIIGRTSPPTSRTCSRVYFRKLDKGVNCTYEKSCGVI